MSRKQWRRTDSDILFFGKPIRPLRSALAYEIYVFEGYVHHGGRGLGMKGAQWR
jgi:hypothetical protein